MHLKTITAVCLAGLLSVGFAAHGLAQSMSASAPMVPDPAIASMSVDQLVTTRQGAMKENGGLLRNALNLTGADAVNASTTLLRNFTNLPALFPEGSVNGSSDASAKIWENFEAFTAIFTQAQNNSAAALAAAQAGDTATYQASIQGIMPLCGACHQQFRGD